MVFIDFREQAARDKVSEIPNNDKVERMINELIELSKDFMKKKRGVDQQGSRSPDDSCFRSQSGGSGPSSCTKMFE